MRTKARALGFWWLSINIRRDSWFIGCGFSHHLLFSSLPFYKSCEIRLEEFRYRDPSWAVARRGGDCGQKHRPRAQPLAARRPRRGGRPLARRLLPAGKGSRCLRRGSGGDDAEEARGVRASF
ncbi:hypothetical protein BHM03_00041331 [Ensete ventricosum]|nr:hypothetical protein BHM03_00041331 [Ensete ventricosum]